MRTKWRKTLALLLAMSMLTGMLGTAAFAAGDEPSAKGSETQVCETCGKDAHEGECVIDSQDGENIEPYAASDEEGETEDEPEVELTEGEKIQKAIDEAEDGVETTITMTADIEGMTSGEIITIPAGKVIVLDMAGHSITVAENFVGRPIVNQGTLTVRGNGTIDSSVGAKGYGAIRNDGTLTIENGTYLGNASADGTAIRNGVGSELTVYGGYFAATGAIYNVSKATIYKGEFVTLACSTCLGVWSYALNNTNEGDNYGTMDILAENDEDVKVHGTQGALACAKGSTVYVKGGTFWTEPCANDHKGSTFYAVYVSGVLSAPSTCTIDGGKFSTSGSVACVYVNNTNPSDNGGTPGQGILNINGGSFEKGDGGAILIKFNAANNSELAVTGGTFSDDVSTYVDPSSSYDPETGKVEPLTADNSVAEVGGKYYATLQAAITAAPSGATVKLLKDVNTTEEVFVTSDTTIDLNGKTYTYSYSDNGAAISVNGGTLTLKDSGEPQGALEAVYTASGYNGKVNAITLNASGNGVVIDETALVKGRVAVFGGTLNVAGTINTIGKEVPCIMGNGECHGTEITITGTVTSGDEKICIYHPQKGTLTIDGGSVTGYAGIGIKSGELNIINGGKVYGVTNDTVLTDGHSASNGITYDGSAIVIDTHASYAGQMVINIVDSTVESTYSHAIKEIRNANATNTNVISLTISGDSNVKGAVELKDSSVAAITGGTFSSDVSDYCVEGMKATEDENGSYTIVIDEETAVAEVNGIGYTSLAKAITVADGGEVKLLKSATESVTIAEGQNITLDIPEGVTLTNAADQHTITNNGTLTVTGAGTVDNESHGKGALVNNGTANLNGGTFTRSAEASTASNANGGNSWYTIDNHGIMIIDGATVNQGGTGGKFSSLIRNIGTEAGEGETAGVLTINSGDFSGGLNTVKNDDWGTLTITGGTFSNTAQHVIMNWNVGTISGGTFICTAEGYKAVFNDQWGEGENKPGKGELSISGGTFSDDVQTWCVANHYAEEGEGVWTVVDHSVEANHKWDDGEVTTAAQIGVEGVRTYTCTVCDAERTETIPALPYPYVPSNPVVTPPAEEDEDLTEGDTPLVSRPFLFVDVAEQDWFYSNVKAMFEKGLIEGMTDTTFEPQATSTRAMVATLMYRIAGQPDVAELEVEIPDMTADAWYRNAAIWAYANGVFGGYEDGTFRGDGAITREQIAAVLHRYAVAKGIEIEADADMSKFADADQISDWAVENMKWAVSAGLINGRDNKLAAQETATRAELATLLVRFDALMAAHAEKAEGAESTEAAE